MSSGEPVAVVSYLEIRFDAYTQHQIIAAERSLQVLSGGGLSDYEGLYPG
jgi:hypothetical protein